MSKRKSAILIDCDVNEVLDYKNKLSEKSGSEWVILQHISNGSRKHLFDDFKRYLVYFIFPFRVFLNRNEYDIIIGWQQFYATLFAFYCRLFHVKKVNKVLVQCFVYRRKKGILGCIYHKFVSYAVKSKYIDVMTVTAKSEIQLYSQIFGVPESKFAYVPWAIIDYSEQIDKTNPPKNDCVFSLGRSNRDWEFLKDSLIGEPYKLKIVCDELKYEKTDNIEVFDNVNGIDALQMMYDSFCVVIPVLNPDVSSGQTVLNYAMQLKKPLIVTKSAGLSDDTLIDGVNGLVIEKSKTALLGAISRLYNEPELYKKITENAYNDYWSLYTKDKLAENIYTQICQFV